MNESLTIEQLYEMLKEMDGSEKINFLEDYLRSDKEIPLDVLAFINETLGNLHKKSGRPVASYFKKAATTWESAAILRQEKKSTQRDFLRNALKNYQIIYKIHKAENYKTGMDETKERINELNNELKKYNNPLKTITVTLVSLVFLFSILLIASPPTGLVIAPLEENETTMIGFLFLVIGLIGGFFIYLKWL